MSILYNPVILSKFIGKPAARSSRGWKGRESQQISTGCQQISIGYRQVVYKDRDNEKEKSPHTPLKGKETEKETATTICCLPSETTLSRARAYAQGAKR